MKVVIEINEEIYNDALDGKFNVTAFNKAVRKHSIPLPKGHGRLKDEDEILTVLIKSAEAHCQNSREDVLMGRVRQQILSCHTIIEADKEKRNNDNSRTVN